MTMRHQTTTAEPEHVRRKLVAGYRKLADGKRLSKAERAEFARTADLWERTLPEKSK